VVASNLTDPDETIRSLTRLAETVAALGERAPRLLPRGTGDHRARASVLGDARPGCRVLGGGSMLVFQALDAPRTHPERIGWLHR
jgi:hypothetical protein